MVDPDSNPLTQIQTHSPFLCLLVCEYLSTQEHYLFVLTHLAPDQPLL